MRSLFLAVLLIVALLVPQAQAATSWNPTAVISTQVETPQIPHMVMKMNSSGDSAVAYYDNVTKSLICSHWDRTSETWINQTLAYVSGRDLGQYPSMDLDYNGMPYVSYLDATSGDLWYNYVSKDTYETLVFHPQLVDNGGNSSVGTGSSICLAYDMQTQITQPAISYLDTTLNNVKLARTNGTTWTVEVLHQAGQAVLGPKTVLHYGVLPDIGKSQLFVAYVEDNNLKLQYQQTDEAKTWTQPETVVTGVGPNFDMDVDEGYDYLTHQHTLRPTFSYFSKANHTLMLVKRRCHGGYDTAEAIDDSFNATDMTNSAGSYYCSLFYSGDHQYLAYNNFPNSLYMAVHTFSGWTKEVIANTTQTFAPSIGFDYNHNLARLAYMDAVSTQVKVLSQTPVNISYLEVVPYQVSLVPPNMGPGLTYNRDSLEVIAHRGTSPSETTMEIYNLTWKIVEGEGAGMVQRMSPDPMHPMQQATCYYLPSGIPITLNNKNVCLQGEYNENGSYFHAYFSIYLGADTDLYYVSLDEYSTMIPAGTGAFDLKSLHATGYNKLYQPMQISGEITNWRITSGLGYVDANRIFHAPIDPGYTSLTGTWMNPMHGSYDLYFSISSYADVVGGISYVTPDPSSISLRAGQSYDLSYITVTAFDANNSITETNGYISGWAVSYGGGTVSGYCYTAPGSAASGSLTADYYDYASMNHFPVSLPFTVTAGDPNLISYMRAEQEYLTVGPNTSFNLNTVHLVGVTMSGSTTEVTGVNQGWDIYSASYAQGSIENNIYHTPAQGYVTLHCTFLSNSVYYDIYISLDIQNPNAVSYVSAEPANLNLNPGDIYPMNQVKGRVHRMDGSSYTVEVQGWSLSYGNGFIDYQGSYHAPMMGGYSELYTTWCEPGTSNYFNIYLYVDTTASNFNALNYVTIRPYNLQTTPGHNFDLSTVQPIGVKMNYDTVELTGEITNWTKDYGDGWIDSSGATPVYVPPNYGGSASLSAQYVDPTYGTFYIYTTITVFDANQIQWVAVEPYQITVQSSGTFPLSSLYYFGYRMNQGTCMYDTVPITDNYTVADWTISCGEGSWVDQTSKVFHASAVTGYQSLQSTLTYNSQTFSIYVSVYVGNQNDLDSVYAVPGNHTLPQGGTFDLATVQLVGMTRTGSTVEINTQIHNWSLQYGQGWIDQNQIYHGPLMGGFGCCRGTYYDPQTSTPYDVYVSFDFGEPGQSETLTSIYLEPSYKVVTPHTTLTLSSPDVKLVGMQMNGQTREITSDLQWYITDGTGYLTTSEGWAYVADATGYADLTVKHTEDQQDFYGYLHIVAGDPDQLQGIYVTPYSLFVNAGDSIEIASLITVNGYTMTGEQRNLTPELMVWNVQTYGTESVGTITNGIYTAPDFDTYAYLNGKYPSGGQTFEAYLGITVGMNTNSNLMYISIDPCSTGVPPNGSFMLEPFVVKAHYMNGTETTLTHDQLTWNVTYGQGQIRNNNEYKAPPAEGYATITCTYSEQGSQMIADLYVNITRGNLIQLDNISVEPAMSYVLPGSTNEIDAEDGLRVHAHYSNGSDEIVNPSEVTWTKLQGDGSLDTGNVFTAPTTPQMVTLRAMFTKDGVPQFADAMVQVMCSTDNFNQIGQFHRMVVDGDNVGRMVGIISSISLDLQGYPHIAYYDLTNGDLRYASYNGFQWFNQLVDSTGDNGMYPSLKLDSFDRPCISYYAKGTGDLKYATYDGLQWRISTVDSSGDVGQFCSMAIDGNNNPRIAYYDKTNQDLKYAIFNGTSWSKQVIDGTGEVGTGASLAIDSNNVPHISYIDATTHHLKYAELVGGTWETRTIADMGIAPPEVNTSLALNQNGQPAVTYYNADDQDLMIAIRDNDVWTREVVDNGYDPLTGYEGDVGGYSSLAFDSNGLPHVSYYDYGNDILRYAYQSAPKEMGGEWIIVPADDFQGSGRTNSLVLDSNNIPHISYSDSMYNSLKYCTLVEGGIDVEGVTGLTIEPAQITINANTQFDLSGIMSFAQYSFGNPMMVSGSITWTVKTGGGSLSGSIYHAPGAGGSAMLEASYTENGRTVTAQLSVNVAGEGGFSVFEKFQINPAAEVYTGGAIVIDSNDRPHFAYFDSNRGSLKHTVWTGSTWEIADEIQNVCGMGKPALALSSTEIHIAYANTAMSGVFPVGGGSGITLVTINRADHTRKPTEEIDTVMTYTVKLKVDRNGRLHLAYMDTANQDLKYAIKTSTGWKPVTVDSKGEVGAGLSLAVDSQNKPHISYIDATNWDVKYACFNGSNWQISAVTSGDDYAMETSIAVDSHDSPHISCYNNNKKDLMHWYRENGLWKSETVDERGDVGSDSRIAIDKDDQVHISYYYQSEGDLKYAFKKNLSGGATQWDLHVVQSEGMVGFGAMIAVDSSKMPHILYNYYNAMTVNGLGGGNQLIYARVPSGPVNQKILTALRLGRTTGEVQINQTFGIGNVRVVAAYSNATTAEVTSSVRWVKKSGQGTLETTVYRAPSENGTAILTATYSDTTETKTADFYLTILGGIVKGADTYDYDATHKNGGKDNSAAAATEIVSGTVQRHSIYPAGDVDWVKFTLSAVSNVVLQTSGEVGGDTYFELYSSTAETSLIQEADDGGTGRYTRMVLDNLAQGTYYLKIRDYFSNSEILDYGIRYTAAATTVATGEVNTAPVVSGISYTGTKENITLTYTLKDNQNSTCTASFEYSLDGSNWSGCTASGGGTSELTSSASGVSHSFSWASADDFQILASNVKIRIRANDGKLLSFYANYTIPSVDNQPVVNKYSLAGSVKTGATAINGATVTLWKKSNKVASAATDQAGNYSFQDVAATAGPYTLIAYKSKYMPTTITREVSSNVTGADISMSLAPTTQLSNTTMVVYGSCKLDHDKDGVLENAIAGDFVAAYTPAGVLCGVFTVKDAGAYGAMSIYGDSNLTTDTVEGAVAGEKISFRLNGTPVSQSTTWIASDFVKLDLAVTGSNIGSSGSRSVNLKLGWNLISLGVQPSNTRIEDIFAKIPEMKYVMGFLRGTDSDGFKTFMNTEYKEFSTLTDMDGYHGYWVYMTGDSILDVQGTAISNNSDYELYVGWNLAGCWINQSANLPTATTQTGTIIDSVFNTAPKTAGGTAKYIMGFYRTTDDGGLEGFRTFMNNQNTIGFSTLSTMDPNMGYWLYMNDAGSLNYSYRVTQ
ncbi:MAG: hypothetical protein PHW04_01355 [Candidatus Wallbacteria bacterium]|nr:hypothetical protein [Candidatus Wallbacteria bacterium]